MKGSLGAHRGQPGRRRFLTLLPYDVHEAKHGWAREKHKLWSELEQLVHPVSREKDARFLSTAVLLPRKRGYGSEHPVLDCIFHISWPTRKCYDPGGWLETAAVELILLKQEERVCVFSS